jgi:MtN3 and saliva related transmembrane protein
MNAELIGWVASGILLATLLRQVWVQWRERSTAGVSSWLFVGQCAASSGFLLYSWLLDNRVFIVTNAMLLFTAVAGQLIYRRNRRRAERRGDPR